MILFEPLGRLVVILVELLSDVRTDVPEPLFDLFSRFQGLFRGNPHLSLAQQLLDEVGDVTASDGNVLDTAADDVTFSLHM